MRSAWPPDETTLDGRAHTFPAADDASLALTLLALLARGEPVASGQLAAETGRPACEVTAALEAWPNVQRDRRGMSLRSAG